MKMISDIENLIQAEKKAKELFLSIEKSGIITPGKTEKQLNTEIYNIAQNQYKIEKFWHKRIVRTGKNTLLPYGKNSPDLLIQKNDIIFFDLGPVFDNWEADVGKTYVLGNDKNKLKLIKDIESAWEEGKNFFYKNKSNLTGADLYNQTKELASKYGWEYNTPHCGHLVGKFPHEKLLGDDINNYIHPDNDQLMSEKDINGNERYWIYEIHFINNELEIGGFFEQML